MFAEFARHIKIGRGKPSMATMSIDNSNIQNCLKHPLKQLGVAALYVLFARVAMLYMSNGAVWPASGLALAVLLIGGKRYIWGLLLGALLSNVTLTATAGSFHWATAILYTLGNLLEALVGAWLITRDGRFDLSMRSLRDYLRLVFLAGFTASLVVAASLTMAMRILGLAAGGDFSSELIRWCSGDFLGIILVTPLFLSWRVSHYDMPEPKRVAECFLLLGATLFAGQAVFLDWFHDSIGHVDRAYWMFLFIIWVAVRLGPRVTAIALATTAAQAMIGVSYGIGFFADYSASNHLNIFRFFIAALSVSGMALAYYIAEHKKIEKALRESDARFQTITGNIPGVTFKMVCAANRRDFNFVYVSEWTATLFGLEPDELMKNPELLCHSLHGGDAAGFDASRMASAAKLELWNWEGRIVTREHGEKWFNLRATPHRREDGMVVFDGVLFNITDSKRIEIELEESRRSLRKLAAADSAAREEERKHIAREVHDELGQILTALRINVSLLRIQFGESNPLLMEKVQGITGLVDRALRGVRNVSADLRPAALDMGVVSAVKWLSKEFTEHAAIPCVLEIEDKEIEGEDFDLDEVRAVVIFRIVQESLTNVARHAEADSVKISMARVGDRLCVKVSDSGKGFDPLSPEIKKSFGLLGMRERAIALGGEIEIMSAPGKGTAISVSIPIRPEEAIP